MSLSREARVGATGLAGVAAAAVLVVFLGRIHISSPGYTVLAKFRYVDSLKDAAPVLYGGGVKIGEVDEISIVGGRVGVKLHIDRGVEIPRSSTVTIHTSGILGEKYVQVSPGTDGDREFLADGAEVEGVDPGSLDRTLQRVEALTEFLEPLVSDPRFKDGVQGILKGMSKLTSDLGAMISENRADVRESVQNLHKLTQDLRARTAELGPVMKNAASILSDANTKKAIHSLQTLDESLSKLDGILTQIESKKGAAGILVYDNEAGENLRSLLSDLKRHPWKLLWKK